MNILSQDSRLPIHYYMVMNKSTLFIKYKYTMNFINVCIDIMICVYDIV